MKNEFTGMQELYSQELNLSRCLIFRNKRLGVICICTFIPRAKVGRSGNMA